MSPPNIFPRVAPSLAAIAAAYALSAAFSLMPPFLAASLNTSSDTCPPDTFLKFSKNSKAPVFALGILVTNL